MADLNVVLDRIRALYPKGSVKIDVACWEYDIDGDHHRRVAWSAWISDESDPARSGRHIPGDSLAEVMAKVEAEAANPPSLDAVVIVDAPVDTPPVPVAVAYPDDDVSF